MRLKRRQLLQALGLGALSSVIRGEPVARAGGPTFPSRIVFYVQPHGHIPNAWKMDIPNGAASQLGERSLTDLAQADQVMQKFAIHHETVSISCRTLSKNGTCSAASCLRNVSSFS